MTSDLIIVGGYATAGFAVGAYYGRPSYGLVYGLGAAILTIALKIIFGTYSVGLIFSAFLMVKVWEQLALKKGRQDFETQVTAIWQRQQS